MTMVESGMKINPGTMQSLKEAIDGNNIYFFDKDGAPSGFVTWFLDGDILEVNNLCLYGSGVHKLFELRQMLHLRYPNLSKVRWHSDKKERKIEYGFH